MPGCGDATFAVRVYIIMCPSQIIQVDDDCMRDNNLLEQVADCGDVGDIVRPPYVSQSGSLGVGNPSLGLGLGRGERVQTGSFRAMWRHRT